MCPEECLIQVNEQLNNLMFVMDGNFFFNMKDALSSHFFSFLLYLFSGEEQYKILKRAWPLELVRPAFCFVLFFGHAMQHAGS